MSRLKRLIVEVHYRSLWQVLLVYIGGALVAYQAVQALTEGLGLPGWFPGLAVVLFIIGLPVVVASALVHESPARPVPSVGSAESASDEAVHDAEARREAASRHRYSTARNAGLAFLAALAVWGVVVTGWLVNADRSQDPLTTVLPALRGPADPATSRYVASVAVLPFDYVGPIESEYLSGGITEEITAQLAQVEGLKVISRTSAVALAGLSLTLPQIADTLGVQHVLEGTAQRAGDEVRVTVQLIEAATDAHLWAKSYTRRLANLFELQDEIARGVSSALITTVGGLRAIGEASRTDKPAAYEAYLRGKYWIHRRTREALQNAMIAFERALTLDASYAPAYAGLAAASGLWVTYGYGGELGHYEAYGRAIVAANRAISLDPNLAEAYAARAYVLTKAWAPAAEVERDFQTALRLLPNSADVHGWYAHLLARDGQFELAMQEAEKAIELDPLAPGRRLGYALDALGARRYDLTFRESQRALVLEPGLLLAKAVQAVSHLLLGQADECLKLDLGRHGALRAMCLHSVGNEQLATSLIDSLRSSVLQGQYDQDYSEAVVLGDIATYYAWIGDVESSLRHLERAYALSPAPIDFRFIYSDLFQRARADPRFEATIRRIWGTIRNRAEAEREDAVE